MRSKQRKGHRCERGGKPDCLLLAADVQSGGFPRQSSCANGPQGLLQNCGGIQSSRCSESSEASSQSPLEAALAIVPRHCATSTPGESRARRSSLGSSTFARGTKLSRRTTLRGELRSQHQRVGPSAPTIPKHPRLFPVSLDTRFDWRPSHAVKK